MPSVFTHAVAAASIGALIVPGRARLGALGMACAVVPDLDVVTLAIGIPYQDIAGHRGLSHSLVFAACVAGTVAWLVAPRIRGDVSTGRLALFLFLATASHGVLDALTDGGLGVAFLAPFSGARYFFPWRPIAVSPISIRRFFSSEGLHILANEFVVVWIPAIVVWAGASALRRRHVPR